CAIAAANTKSKNNSIQPGRRTWRSWAGQTLGLMRRRDLRLRSWLTFAEIAARSSEPLPEARILPTFLVSDRGSGARSSDFGDVLIFLRSVSADADRADDFVFEDDRNAALQRRRSGQSQRSYATVTHLIFKHFAWPPENRRSPCFAYPNLDARNLRV